MEELKKGEKKPREKRIKSDKPMKTPKVKKEIKEKKSKESKKLRKSKISSKVDLKNNIRGSRFGKKLTITLILCILLPVILGGSVLYFQFKNYINNDVESNNTAILQDVQKTIQTKLENVTTSLLILSKVDYVKKMQPFLVESMFLNVQESNPLIVNITVIDKTGHIKYSSIGEEGDLKSEYIDKALAGDINYSDISIHGSGTETRKVIKQSIPIYDSQENIKGVLIGEISLDNIVTMVTELTLPKSTEVLLVSPEAILLAHSNQEKFNKMYKKPLTDYVPYKKAKLDVTDSDKAVFESTEYLMTYSKIAMLDWTVAAQIPVQKAYSKLTTTNILFGSIIIIALIAGFIISKLIANSITKPLTNIARVANFAQEGDFTKDVDPEMLKRKDEFGDLSIAFSTMINSFRDVIRHLTSSTAVLDKSSEDLVDASSSSTEILSEIVIKAENLSGAANEDIERANEVVRSVGEMADGSENVAKNTDNLNMLIKNNVTFASTGVQMMEETSTLIDKAVNSYAEIENNMTSLQKAALNIGGITDAIMNIAGQTNLLALNAAIEAARAGEAGRGFAVVANEIRNLADQSNKSAGNITTLITDIQNDIDQTTHLFNVTSKMLGKVVEESNKTMSQINDILNDSQKASLEIDEISAVTEEHAATSAHIDEKMNGMLTTLMDTLSTATEMSNLINMQNEKNLETIDKIESIKSVSEQFKDLIGTFKL